ncbi:putative lipid-transfer protein DIR1 [Ananas comosus]|uniref:Bifunctional inhibitor/plant lipid transfer protein/seed storage helical domain-containing protein n=2 Tax=Ananas comosus TaxID=4615 RepID=A0A6V7QS55_ANACO|nr:putative lipid-transfer protein DIR1 [Ananas comosus]
MEKKLRAVAIALVAMLLVVAASTEAAQGLCNMSDDGLAACKPAIAVKKPVDKPSDACCAALADADLQCLCKYKSSGMLKYFEIDANRAMQLPAKCNITAPSQC